jgi:hypothetical protein
MNCKIAIAFSPMSAPNQPSPTVDAKRAIRRDLAKLWLAQTFRDMVIIGLTRAEMKEITQAALKGWCYKPAALDYNERRSKDE